MSYGVIMDVQENIVTPQTPMTSCEPLGPLQSNMIPQDSLHPPEILGPLRTTSGPLNTPSVLLGPLRILQGPSEPLRAL